MGVGGLGGGQKGDEEERRGGDMRGRGVGGLQMALGSEPHVEGKIREKDVSPPGACLVLQIKAYERQDYSLSTLSEGMTPSL